MAFNFFRKKETPAPKAPIDESDALSLEELNRVDGGYQKTQDDINKILAESEYIAEKRDKELSEMFAEGHEETTKKSYSK